MTISTAFFPLMGSFIGLSALAAWSIASSLWPPGPAAWWALLVPVVLTGGLHLDGLMDTADGIFSGRPREKMLEIMRDSRIGSMGFTAGLFFLLGSYTGLVSMSAELLPVALLTAPGIGRLAMVLAMAHYPYARQDQGTGSLFTNIRWPQLLVAGLYTCGLTLFLLGLRSIPTIIAALAVGLLAAHWLAAKLGGLTGDCYGAINQVVELTVILLLALN